MFCPLQLQGDHVSRPSSLSGIVIIIAHYILFVHIEEDTSAFVPSKSSEEEPVNTPHRDCKDTCRNVVSTANICVDIFVDQDVKLTIWSQGNVLSYSQSS
uniref:Uncharacterized protein n=1 Tax=Anguilla anguilla TaxID=7936 RepID=A0A0E9V4Q8_ANGAN